MSTTGLSGIGTGMAAGTSQLLLSTSRYRRHTLDVASPAERRCGRAREKSCADGQKDLDQHRDVGASTRGVSVQVVALLERHLAVDVLLKVHQGQAECMMTQDGESKEAYKDVEKFGVCVEPPVREAGWWCC